MSFIIFNKLTLQAAVENMELFEEFFRKNPKRKICVTDLFAVRRGHVVEDTLKHSVYQRSENKKEN